MNPILAKAQQFFVQCGEGFKNLANAKRSELIATATAIALIAGSIGIFAAACGAGILGGILVTAIVSLTLVLGTAHAAGAKEDHLTNQLLTSYTRWFKDALQAASINV